MHFTTRQPLLWLMLLFPLFTGAQTFWMQHAGGSTIDEGMDISIDGAGNTYVTGYFTTGAAFGNSSLSSSGVDDVFLAQLGTNGIFNWAVKAGGSNSDRALSIKTDAAGNSYITGYFYGTAAFGSNSLTAAGSQDIFIAKYDNTGTCLWAKSAGGTGADIGNGITVDNSGNVIVTGEFAGTATFGSSSLSSMNGSTDVFTTKLDAAGNFQWAKKGSAPQTDRGLDVDCDASGNIYITGQFSDTITFDVPHNNNMLNAVFVVKYNPAGQEQWFRRIGGGAMNIANSIACDPSGAILLTGDFQGTLSFFGNTTTTLTHTYSNRIFIAKYDQSGGLTWSIAESSDSPLSSRSITANATHVFIGGHFKCTLDSYSDIYGTGAFNSSGFWDVFEGQYTTAGAWVVGRQLGGKKDQRCNGITVDGAGHPHVIGSYEDKLVTPVNNAFYGYFTFSGYNMTLSNNIVSSNYCNDPYYSSYALANSTGNSDVFVGNPYDPARALYDYYYRQGTGCTLPYEEVCIHQYSGLDYGCQGDTVDACTFAQLQAATQTSLFSPTGNGVGPNFSYLWSTGGTADFTTAMSTGYYSVVITSEDGCYVSEDTIFVQIHPPPAIPVISDDVVINTNAVAPIDIKLCDDSVLLTGGNFGNSTTTWLGPQFGLSGTSANPVMVDSSGTYTFLVTDAFGCTNATSVEVIIDHPLQPIVPDIICLNDSDFNDSLRFCAGESVFFYPFDTISNPLHYFECIEYLDSIVWTITPGSPDAMILPYTNCDDFAYAISTATIDSSGTYTVTGVLIRENACGTDTTVMTYSFYADVLPSPPSGNIPIVIIGDSLICPGDTAMLVVTGAPSTGTLIWNNMMQNDTIYVTQAGTYSVAVLDSLVNSYGCLGISSGADNFTVTVKPQPVITMLPSDGVICPGDSVQLISSGSGTFQWQGPNGPLGGNVNSIYVTSPGTYYCIVTDAGGCELLANTVSIQQYNTPQIQVSPSQVICPGDTVVLNITANSGSTITWAAPLSGSATTQYITQPGTYSCTVIACSIPTTVSVTILPTAVSADITALSSMTVCEGDSVLLGANAGMDFYQWLPGNDSSLSVYVYSSGLYYLTTADTGGCQARDSIQVSFQQNTLPLPVASDTVVCRGLSTTLFAYGAPTLSWYGTPGGSPLATGSFFQTPAIFKDTIFYVQTNDGVCRSQPTPVNVTTQECESFTPNVFTPNGDGVNDSWALYEPYAKAIHVWIYDRWGILVYEYTQTDGSWPGTYMGNGEMVTDGVYYYIAHITEPTDILRKQSGFIQLIH